VLCSCRTPIGVEWGTKIMRKAMVAGAVAAALLVQPGCSQQAAPLPTTEAVTTGATELDATTEEERIPAQHGQNQMSPGSFALATGGAVLVAVALSFAMAFAALGTAGG
jgi:hypothetical protein